MSEVPQEGPDRFIARPKLTYRAFKALQLAENSFFKYLRETLCCSSLLLFKQTLFCSKVRGDERKTSERDCKRY